MYRTSFPDDLFSELERLQRQFLRFPRGGTSIRGGGGGYPALNIGSTADSVEIFVFAPGLDPASVDVTVERGVLRVSGERKSELPEQDQGASLHTNERFAGRFLRAVNLSDDADPTQVAAKYADGVLHISVKRHEVAKRRRIEVQ